MNFAHLHLILNHLPIIGIPIVLVFFSYSLWCKNKSLQTFALVLLVGFSALVVPVFLTGEPAEKLVQSLPEVSEAVIEPHEETGELAMYLTLSMGVAALLALGFQRTEKKNKALLLLVLFLGALASGVLLRTGFLGGQIRHTEIRPDLPTSLQRPRE